MSIADVSNKDAMQILRRKWIAEFPEIDSLSRTEQGHVKAYFSRQVDTYRPSYGKGSLIIHDSDIRCDDEQIGMAHGRYGRNRQSDVARTMQSRRRCYGTRDARSISGRGSGALRVRRGVAHHGSGVA